jgi:hypothetical protein
VPQTTEAAGGAHMEFSARLAGMPLRGSGVLDMQHDAYSMSGGLGASGKGQVVMTGNKLYVTLPASLRKGPLAGKRWGMVDLARAASADKGSGVDLSNLATSTAPGSMLEQLRGVGDVKVVGTDTLRGVATTRFRATVDLHKAIALLPPARRAQMQPAVDQLLQTGQSSVPVEAWVDRERRLRREIVTLAGLGTMRLDLSDFGGQRRVVAPPADQTADLSAPG